LMLAKGLPARVLCECRHDILIVGSQKCVIVILL
jgi:hypothetical protein